MLITFFNENTLLCSPVKKTTGRTVEVGGLLLALSKRYDFTIKLFSSPNINGPTWYNPQENNISLDDNLVDSNSIGTHAKIAFETGHVFYNQNRAYAHFSLATRLLNKYLIILVGLGCLSAFLFKFPIEALSGLITIFIIVSTIFIIEECIANLIGLAILRNIFKLSFKHYFLLAGLSINLLLRNISGVLIRLLIILTIYYWFAPQSKYNFFALFNYN